MNPFDVAPALVEQAALLCEQRFGRPPHWTAVAPGRVNLIGEHVDYNQGLVLPMAIERWTVLAAVPSAQARARFWSADRQEEPVIALDAPIRPVRSWADYPGGVLAGFQQRGVSVPGFDAVACSSVPIGAGLSSSAALEVATATLIERITGHTLQPMDKVSLCQKAEQDYAGVPCGLMDQFTAAMAQTGTLLLLDCRTHTFTPVSLAAPCRSVLIIDSKVRHDLKESAYADRLQECQSAARHLGVASLRDATPERVEQSRPTLPPALYRRTRHVVSEIARTQRTATALRNHQWSLAGQLMYESHRSLRDDYEVSCRELDVIVDTARSIGERGGVFGCRMTGGGFGGCAVCLVREDQIESVSEILRTRCHAATGMEPGIFASRPAGGAFGLTHGSA